MQPEAPGKGWHGSPELHGEAGKKGGKSLVEKRGSEYMREIGRKGGRALVQKHGQSHMERIGKKGGEAAQDNAHERRLPRVPLETYDHSAR